jgi:hypothetical protein
MRRIAEARKDVASLKARGKERNTMVRRRPLERACVSALVLVAASVAALSQPSPEWGVSVGLWNSIIDLPSPRALLDRQVEVHLTGTVADAVRKLVCDDQDWLVSAPGPRFGPPAEFRAEGLPLWQALDRLRDVYSYDWGYVSGAVVCWPTTEPRSPRDTPKPPVRAWPPNAGALGPIAAGGLMPVEQFLAQFTKRGCDLDLCVDHELAGWHVIGRVSHVDRYGVEVVAGALDAVMEGAYQSIVLRPGGRYRLDAALAWLKANPQPPPDPRYLSGGPVEIDQERILSGSAAQLRFRERVLACPSAQQWRYLHEWEEIDFAFRELPTDVAGLFVAAAKDQITKSGDDLVIDWSHPERMKVEFCMGLPPRDLNEAANRKAHFVPKGVVPLTIPGSETVF